MDKVHVNSAAKNFVRERPVNDVVSRWPCLESDCSFRLFSNCWRLIKSTSKSLRVFSGGAMASSASFWPRHWCAQTRTSCRRSLNILMSAWHSRKPLGYFYNAFIDTTYDVFANICTLLSLCRALYKMEFAFSWTSSTKSWFFAAKHEGLTALTKLVVFFDCSLSTKTKELPIPGHCSTERILNCTVCKHIQLKVMKS